MRWSHVHLAGWRRTRFSSGGLSRRCRLRHLPSSRARVIRLSCHRRPRGSQPAFASGDVPTRIHPATGWRSLCPRSFARCTNSLPCGRPAVAGDASGLPRSAHMTRGGVGPACTPVVILSVCSVQRAEQPTTHLFWFKPVSIFGLFILTMSTAVHLC